VWDTLEGVSTLRRKKLGGAISGGILGVETHFKEKSVRAGKKGRGEDISKLEFFQRSKHVQ